MKLKNTFLAVAILYTASTFNPKYTLSYPINYNTINTIIEAQQITDDEFKEADKEYNRLTSLLNKLHNEMSKASESGNSELYNKLKEGYDKATTDRKEFEKIRMEFMRQDKELVGVKKIYNAGNIAYKLGKTAEALSKYNDVIKKGIETNSPALDETIARAYYQIGIINKNQKKFQDAINAFSNAIKYNSNYESAYLALGNTYKDTNKPSLAIENYQKAIEINNSFYQAYYNLGTIYLSQYNQLKRTELLDNAESAFRDAARINPKYYLAHTSLGRILLEKKRAIEAIDALNKSVSVQKNYYLQYYYLARAYNQLNDPNGAIENGLNCLKYRKNFAPAFIEIGDAHLKKKEETKAIEYYEKALNDRRYRKLAEYKIDMIRNKDEYIP